MSPLSGWDNFYVIVGSSAGALTGLTFVAVTQIVESPRRGAGRTIPTFTTPTVVHFAMALFLSAVLSAPWPALSQLSVFLTVSGLGMLIYGVYVVLRLRRQDQQIYSPVLEDWLWYGIAPLIAYAGLLVAAVFLPRYPTPALFGIAGAMLLLLFNGLHNAWDLVTYIVLLRVDDESADDTAERGAGTPGEG